MIYTIAVIIASAAFVAKVSLFSLGPFAHPGLGADPVFGYTFAATSLVTLLLSVFPVGLTWYRWWKNPSRDHGLLPSGFRHAARGAYTTGIVFISLGHAAALGYLGQLGKRALMDHVAGPVDGFGWTTLLLYKLGPTLVLYWIGMFIVEVCVRKWSRTKAAA